MKSREDVLKRLRADPMYRRALEKAKDEKERKAIIAFTEDFVTSFADVLLPLAQQAQKDPVLRERLARSLVEGREVLSDSVPETSGSHE
jgi:hypothetical protein